MIFRCFVAVVLYLVLQSCEDFYKYEHLRINKNGITVLGETFVIDSIKIKNSNKIIYSAKLKENSKGVSTLLFDSKTNEYVVLNLVNGQICNNSNNENEVYVWIRNKNYKGKDIFQDRDKIQRFSTFFRCNKEIIIEADRRR